MATSAAAWVSSSALPMPHRTPIVGRPCSVAPMTSNFRSPIMTGRRWGARCPSARWIGRQIWSDDGVEQVSKVEGLEERLGEAAWFRGRDDQRHPAGGIGEHLWDARHDGGLHGGEGSIPGAQPFSASAGDDSEACSSEDPLISSTPGA